MDEFKNENLSNEEKTYHTSFWGEEIEEICKEISDVEIADKELWS